MANPTLFSWLRPSVARRPRRFDSKPQRCQHRPFVRLHLETLEDRIVPSTYDLSLANQTGLVSTQYSIYVFGFSTGGDIGPPPNNSYGPMVLTLPSGSHTAQFTSYSGLPSSGSIPLYPINDPSASDYVTDIETDSTTPVAGARVYFLVVPKSDPPPSVTYSNSGVDVSQPAYSDSNDFVYAYLEVTQPPDSIQTGNPTIDVSAVNHWTFPITVTLNDGLGQVGQNLSTTAVNRESILDAYKSFTTGTAYNVLLDTNDSIDGQPEGIINPSQYLQGTNYKGNGKDDSSNLANVWTSTLQNLFETGRTLSINVDGTDYQGTAMQLGTDWVIQFVGGGNTINIYSPLTPDPALAPFPTDPSQIDGYAAYQVFAAAGVFQDISSNVTTNPAADSVALELEDDINEALNRGVALSSPSTWATETTWYPSGATDNLFSEFMHTEQINGTNIFTLPNGMIYTPTVNNPALPPVKDAQGTWMAQAYGFAMDETPPDGPNVPAKFDPVPNAIRLSRNFLWRSSVMEQHLP